MSLKTNYKYGDYVQPNELNDAFNLIQSLQNILNSLAKFFEINGQTMIIGKTGSKVSMSAGNIDYDADTEYSEGSVGNQIQTLTSTINQYIGGQDWSGYCTKKEFNKHLTDYNSFKSETENELSEINNTLSLLSGSMSGKVGYFYITKNDAEDNVLYGFKDSSDCDAWKNEPNNLKSLIICQTIVPTGAGTSADVNKITNEDIDNITND